MNQEDHIELFVIEDFVITKGVGELSEPLYVGFSMGDNYILGNRNDIEEHTSSEYSSFGSPLSTKKANDQVSSFLLTINTIFIF